MSGLKKILFRKNLTLSVLSERRVFQPYGAEVNSFIPAARSPLTETQLPCGRELGAFLLGVVFVFGRKNGIVKAWSGMKDFIYGMERIFNNKLECTFTQLD
ncbi:unnamed protein product [Clavelina lepadiformis]|uniref:Uncharacterized protein n=1 Tax=Clavelina lepadiformis TaxID=159417 RepID=A0ABP0G6N7_CLALP